MLEQSKQATTHEVIADSASLSQTRKLSPVFFGFRIPNAQQNSRPAETLETRQNPKTDGEGFEPTFYFFQRNNPCNRHKRNMIDWQLQAEQELSAENNPPNHNNRKFAAMQDPAWKLDLLLINHQ